MKQQINLYVRKEKVKVPFSAASCLLIVCISAAVLIAVFAYNWQGVDRLNAELSALKEEQSRLQQAFDRARNQQVIIEESPRLKAELRSRDLEIKAKQRYESLLGQLQPGKGIRFSSMLSGLSTQAVDGIWLKRIKATEAGRVLNLEGETLIPELVPHYLKRLGKSEPVYFQARFDQLKLIGSEQGLSFTVAATLRSGDDN
ncbi:hypothetical protein [Motiliproteus sp. MSK22-1]|uniref:hypothetical protein n=1 Tax=Motiliproteus sp. MSK22-1 TaxID=1897630 RepID=UPI00097655F4|nr:hypothetical protein [Motiliproteus sp. MSK22-1]OMH39525.1 hypothetical protein BGP75_02740 [Motiliproteus sp. MSK22-1]